MTGGYRNLTSRFHYEGDEVMDDALIVRITKEQDDFAWPKHDRDLAGMQVYAL